MKSSATILPERCFATEDQKYGMAWFLDKNRDKPAKQFQNK